MAGKTKKSNACAAKTLSNSAALPSRPSERKKSSKSHTSPHLPRDIFLEIFHHTDLHTLSGLVSLTDFMFLGAATAFADRIKRGWPWIFTNTNRVNFDPNTLLISILTSYRQPRANRTLHTEISARIEDVNVNFTPMYRTDEIAASEEKKAENPFYPRNAYLLDSVDIFWEVFKVNSGRQPRIYLDPLTYTEQLELAVFPGRRGLDISSMTDKLRKLLNLRDDVRVAMYLSDDELEEGDSGSEYSEEPRFWMGWNWKSEGYDPYRTKCRGAEEYEDYEEESGGSVDEEESE